MQYTFHEIIPISLQQMFIHLSNKSHFFLAYIVFWRQILVMFSMANSMFFSQFPGDNSQFKEQKISPFSDILTALILSYQGLRLSNLTRGLTALIFPDWIRHKPKIVTINMINHKAVQKIDKHQASR